MVREHLDSIREREAQAAGRVEQARVESAAIIEKSHEEGGRLLDERKIEGGELMRRMIAEAREKAGARIEALRSESEGLKARLDDSAAGRRSEALDIIIDSFRNG